MRYTLLLMLFASFLHGQFDYGCDGERYINEVLPDIEKTTVIYGSNLDVTGELIDLSMDIYSPQNDDANGRPAIVFAHGGSFIGGSRDEMDDICRRYARSGYVSATIDYRLLNLFQGLPDSVKALDIAVKASHDMKGAIRWFKNSAINDGNPYNIDPDMMFIGGYSAGAVTALITGILDEDEATLPFIVDLLEENGGFQGTTGNPDYLPLGEEIRGIVNYSGAIYDLSWFDEEDPIVASYHGTADETVPYDYAFVVVLGQEIVPLHGSGSFHEHLDELGIDNYLYTVPGGGHVDIYFGAEYEEERTQALADSDTILGTIICGTLVDVEDIEYLTVKTFPNPTETMLFFEGLSSSATIRIYNAAGELISESSYNNGLDVSAFTAGVFYYTAQDESSTYAGKFIKL